MKTCLSNQIRVALSTISKLTVAFCNGGGNIALVVAIAGYSRLNEPNSSKVFTSNVGK